MGDGLSQLPGVTDGDRDRIVEGIVGPVHLRERQRLETCNLERTLLRRDVSGAAGAG
jgi:hypothetical protein